MALKRMDHLLILDQNDKCEVVRYVWGRGASCVFCLARRYETGSSGEILEKVANIQIRIMKTEIIGHG